MGRASAEEEVGVIFRLGGLRAWTPEGTWDLQCTPVVIESKGWLHCRDPDHTAWRWGYRLVFWDSQDQQRYARTSGQDFLKLRSDFVVSAAELDRAQAALFAYRSAASRTVPVCVTNNVDKIGGARGTIIGVDQHGAHFLVRIPTIADCTTSDRIFMVLPQDLTVLADSEVTG